MISKRVGKPVCEGVRKREGKGISEAVERGQGQIASETYCDTFQSQRVCTQGIGMDGLFPKTTSTQVRVLYLGKQSIHAAGAGTVLHPAPQPGLSQLKAGQ